MKTYICCAAAICALFAIPDRGTAAITSWTNQSSGSWGTAGNWSGGLPGSSDDVSINSNGTYTVTVDNNTANNDLGMAVTSITVGASSGLPSLDINFTNTTKTLTLGSGNIGTLGVGIIAGTHGLLSITTGQVSAAHLHLGSGGSGSTGDAVISGGTVKLRSTAAVNWLRIGQDVNSTGTLVMTGGELTGPDFGGAYGNIGGAGKGTLIISNGTFTAGGWGLYVGATTGEGVLKLFGGELIQTNGVMEVGAGVNSRATVLVDGGTMIFTNTAAITVGVRSGSRATMTIISGLVDMYGTVAVGARIDSYGEWNVAGGTSLCRRTPWGLLAGNMATGGGTGIVNVTAGYMGVLNGWTYPGGGPGGLGIINVSGGLCEFHGLGFIMGDGNGAWSELNITGGDVDVTGATYIRSGAITVNGGTLTATTTRIGTTGGTGPIAKTGSVTVISGTLTLGNTYVGGVARPGTLEIQGKNSTNTLNILTATNTTSTLKFTLGADGVSPITVSNALTVNADTKLVIDADNYEKGNGLSVVLIAYGSKVGTINAGNITIIGDTGTIDQITDNKITLILSPIKGTIIQIR